MFGDIASIANSAGTDSATKAALSQEKLEKDLNQFLNLLVAQLKNQDPLDPLDANEFTSQLVQFAGVEQQIYQNSNLEKLVGIQETSQVGAMVNYLGNFIEANGKSFNFEDGLGQFSYNLEEKAHKATLTIQDVVGTKIWSGEIGTDAGKEIFHWDGVQADGTIAVPGPYTAVISATDRDGNLINVNQTVYGRVTAAGADQGKVTLSMGSIDAPLDDILNVRDTALPVPTVADAEAEAAAAAESAAIAAAAAAAEAAAAEAAAAEAAAAGA